MNAYEQGFISKCTEYGIPVNESLSIMRKEAFWGAIGTGALALGKWLGTQAVGKGGMRLFAAGRPFKALQRTIAPAAISTGVLSAVPTPKVNPQYLPEIPYQGMYT